MIYILMDAIRTGKTSALLNWSKKRNDIDGLLCPDDENGKRYFLKVKTKAAFLLEVETETEDVIVIGAFQFLKSAFDEANNYLLHLNEKKDFSYLIIDELGKLELKNKGLHLAAKTLIPDFIFNDKKHLILVVRESLLDVVIEHYDIKSYRPITKEDLAKNSLT